MVLARGGFDCIHLAINYYVLGLFGSFEEYPTYMCSSEYLLGKCGGILLCQTTRYGQITNEGCLLCKPKCLFISVVSCCITINSCNNNNDIVFSAVVVD